MYCVLDPINGNVVSCAIVERNHFREKIDTVPNNGKTKYKDQPSFHCWIVHYHSAHSATLWQLLQQVGTDTQYFRILSFVHMFLTHDFLSVRGSKCFRSAFVVLRSASQCFLVMSQCFLVLFGGGGTRKWVPPTLKIKGSFFSKMFLAPLQTTNCHFQTCHSMYRRGVGYVLYIPIFILSPLQQMYCYRRYDAHCFHHPNDK